MLTSQIAGVDDTKRYTKVVAEGANSEVMITEKLLTHADQHAVSEMDVILNGEGSRTRVISRSVAKEASTQVFYPRVQGNAPCFGHVSCDAIIMGTAKVRAIPEISCNHVDAGLIHEAAIGRIAGRAASQARDAGSYPGGSRGENPRGLPALSANTQPSLPLLTGGRLFCAHNPEKFSGGRLTNEGRMV